MLSQRKNSLFAILVICLTSTLALPCLANFSQSNQTIDVQVQVVNIGKTNLPETIKIEINNQKGAIQSNQAKIPNVNINDSIKTTIYSGTTVYNYDKFQFTPSTTQVLHMKIYYDGDGMGYGAAALYCTTQAVIALSKHYNSTSCHAGGKFGMAPYVYFVYQK